MDLSDIGEFGFLERLARWVPRGSAAVGIGDDAAVLDVSEGSSVVATTDVLVEGVHFRWDWSKPADIGYKSITANVSDLAAMGARPRWLLVALCAQRSIAEETLRELYEGIEAACRDYSTQLVGGDIVRSDRFTLSVTALGEVVGDPLRRSGAKVGDVLAVTGPLGRAAAGVNLLLSQDPKRVSPEDALACMAAHTRPVARVEQGMALRRTGVHAAIDVSDGLASDVRRLTEASGVGAEVDIARLPVAEEARRVAEARGWDIERIVLGGGEDYELLVALPSDQLASLEIALLPVGRVVDDGLWLVRDRAREPLDHAGWDHFKS